MREASPASSGGTSEARTSEHRSAESTEGEPEETTALRPTPSARHPPHPLELGPPSVAISKARLSSFPDPHNFTTGTYLQLTPTFRPLAHKSNICIRINTALRLPLRACNRPGGELRRARPRSPARCVACAPYGRRAKGLPAPDAEREPAEILRYAGSRGLRRGGDGPCGGAVCSCELRNCAWSAWIARMYDFDVPCIRRRGNTAE
ncbi:hypothetical protein OH77DRAFT_1424620 [Trametes cingulata]|nr:hypothetical protein OH77DRAFT_1424620 [Trametes cingulata]